MALVWCPADPGETTGQMGRWDMQQPPIRDAATVILYRRGNDGPSVLMGQRGRQAVFMPDKFVFPGGAVDAADRAAPLVAPLAPQCQNRLQTLSTANPDQIAAAAIRELWEEAGLILGAPQPWPDPPADWRSFAATGHRPSGHALHFVFRAITPPGNPRRFDARFFLADAEAIIGDPDDFSLASDELRDLHWIPLAEVSRLDLPFITEIVLAEVAALADPAAPPPSVPFFDNSGPEPVFHRL